ncbi:MAG: acyl carrier protein [Agarilytica sp.]
MESKESIYQHLQEILAELFEVEKSEITPESRLYEDLDIDSIDAVDMIVKLKTYTKKRLEPSDFKSVRTVQDVVDAIYALLNEEEKTDK